MFYYLYKVTNKVNNKIYVGVHKTKNLDDGYMGSGKVIKRSIEKYGLENFEKEILEMFETLEEMYTREKEIVNEEFLAREDTYNLRRGGNGGFDYINKDLTREQRQSFGKFGGEIGGKIHKQKLINDSNYKNIVSERMRNTQKKYKQNGLAWGYNQDMNERSKTPEAIKKRKETFEKINHQQGEKNSQFNTIWITNGTENKKIKKDASIPDGWKKGRII